MSDEDLSMLEYFCKQAENRSLKLSGWELKVYVELKSRALPFSQSISTLHEGSFLPRDILSWEETSFKKILKRVFIINKNMSKNVRRDIPE